MSAPDAPISREEQILETLAELDLALAQRVHAKAMAAEDVDEINSLGRTYQRIARSVRQSLMAKARLAREREAAARRRRDELDDDFGLLDDLRDFGPPPVRARPEAGVAARIDEACAALRPHLERERPDFDEADERQMVHLVRELAEYDDFLEVSVEVLADRVLEMLGYPPAYGGAFDAPGPGEGVSRAGPAVPAVHDSA